jgi:hypothetical protein
MRGDTEVKAAFVHHKEDKWLQEQCELRSKAISQEQIKKFSTGSRNQRQSMLMISMWKYLKTNLTVDMRQWEVKVADMKKAPMLVDLIKFAHDILANNHEFILDDTLPRVSYLMINRDSRIGIDPRMEKIIYAFLDSHDRDWHLHTKIARESLEFFLVSDAMKEIRHRMMCVLCHLSVLKQASPDLLDLDASTEEWRLKFVSYLTLTLTFVFLSVDWIKIFK